MEFFKMREKIKRVKPKEFETEKKEDPGYSAGLVAKILHEEIEPKFSTIAVKSKPRYLKGFGNKKKYKKILTSIYDYLAQLKEENYNEMHYLIEDYLTSVYERYATYKRKPFMNQIGPSEKNQEGFLIWVDKWETYYGEKYWLEAPSNLTRAKSLALQHSRGKVGSRWYNELDKDLKSIDFRIVEV
jgi:hypothetical protein